MKFFLILLLSVYPSFLLAMGSMVNGTGINKENKNVLWNTSLPYAIARQGQRAIDDNEVVTGFIEIGDSIYSISSKPSLIKTLVNGRKVDANWLLNHWSHQIIAPEQQKAYDTFHMDYPPATYQLGMVNKSIGCYASTPLRYGDIEGDGKNEMVLFLDNDMVVFSPEYQRIVFAQSLDASDWVDAGVTANAYSRTREGVGPHAVQFLSSLAYFNDAEDIYGNRVYSKLYLGDFDKDNNPDIVVWTKAYRSKLKSDPIPGFDPIRQNWYHFERDLTAQADSPAGVTGEYLPQTTDEATIKTWLTDNALTWKEGYPDVSECTADAGKPIPEMSDPLLNDPEVLQ